MTSLAHRIRTGIALSATAAAVVATSACGGSSSDTSPTTSFTGTIGQTDLSTVCPKTVTIQTDWYPEAEHGHLYQLLGPNPTIDANAKKVSGPLFDNGSYTGVNVEIRSGGPAIGNQSVTSQMFQDDSILLGYVDQDQTIQTSASKKTTAVFSPLNVSPQMIMWDPATYPQVKTIADLKKVNATVLYFSGSTYMDYLTGAGVLNKAQIDGSYDGTPATFVAAGGKKAQQGYASSEPYLYENEVQGWKKPVAFQLVDAAGFPTYKSAIAVRSADLDKDSPCLQKLVPVLQRAEVAYMTSPEATNDLIVKVVSDFNSGWVYDKGQADFAVKQMKDLKLVANGPDNTIGAFDPSRVAHMIDITRPIFAQQKTPIASDLTPEQVATNKFLDKSISLP
ncbi:MAG: ABC transporter substrate-binding protein [Gordonia sp. (in: high G+C Gram-positive bacteria)]